MDLCIMKLSFKTSRFLTTSFAAITLMMGAAPEAQARDITDEDIAEVEAIFAKRGPAIAEKAAANRSVIIAPGQIPGEEEAARIDAINHNTNSPDDSLLGQPNEILMKIFWSLDPKSLTAAAQTSKGLAEVIATPYFQGRYCALAPDEYDAFVVQLPELFGEEIGGRLQEFLLDKPVYVHGLDLAGLMDPENLTLLQANNSAMLREIFRVQVPGEDDLRDPLPIEKALTLASYAKSFFTEDMGGFHRARLITALASFNLDQIAVVTAHADQLFTAAMTGVHRARLITALAPLNVDRIAVVAAHADQLFTADMGGFDRDRIIEALAPLNVDQIAEFVGALATHAPQLFTEDMTGLDRAHIITPLAPLSPDQIAVVASHADQLFTAAMDGYSRSHIITALAPLGPDQITVVTAHADQLFTAGMTGLHEAYIIEALPPLNVDQITVVAGRLDAENSFAVILKKVRAYTEELRAKGELREQQGDDTQGDAQGDTVGADVAGPSSGI